MITLFGSGFAGFGWAKSPGTAETSEHRSAPILPTLQIAEPDRVGKIAGEAIAYLHAAECDFAHPTRLRFFAHLPA
jgi:hypothetical protein